MNYVDARFLTPLSRKERASARIARSMAGLPTGQLATSRWTKVEFASRLAPDARMGTDAGEARTTETLFEEVVAPSARRWPENTTTTFSLTAAPYFR